MNLKKILQVSCYILCIVDVKADYGDMQNEIYCLIHIYVSS